MWVRVCVRLWMGVRARVWVWVCMGVCADVCGPWCKEDGGLRAHVVQPGTGGGCSSRAAQPDTHLDPIDRSIPTYLGGEGQGEGGRERDDGEDAHGCWLGVGWLAVGLCV